MPFVSSGLFEEEGGTEMSSSKDANNGGNAMDSLKSNGASKSNESIWFMSMSIGF